MLSKEEQPVKMDIPTVSIIIPTYNESQNIIELLKAVENNLNVKTNAEIIVVDDNSPDGTGKIVEDFINSNKKNPEYQIELINRKGKKGLSSAILEGIQNSKGNTVVVMDSDFSHPPNMIPKLINTLNNSQCDIVVASRYTVGGGVLGWPLKRKLISKVATKIAQRGLGIKSSDPMSGFFAFKRPIIQNIKFDAIGYKMLLEILVKTKGVNVKEIPFIFTNRQLGSSKLSTSTIFDYVKAVWKLYRYGQSVEIKEKRISVHFLSKAGRFFTVGASGVAVNYFVSLLFGGWMADLWYLHANVIGIIFSMTTNFVLNKIWTFEDRDFATKKVLSQYVKFVGFSTLGAVIQLGMVFTLVDEYQVVYPLALILAIFTAAFGNFILNKRFTFKEKIWS